MNSDLDSIAAQVPDNRTTKARVHDLVVVLTQNNHSLREAFAAAAKELGLGIRTVENYYYVHRRKAAAIKAVKHRKVADTVAHKPSSVKNGLTSLEKTAATLMMSDRKEADKIFTREYLGMVGAKLVSLIN